MKLVTIVKFYVLLWVLLFPNVTKAWWTFRYWDREQVNHDHQSSEPALEEDDDIGAQLAAVRCPARINRNLTDYWKCLWHTSITVEGMKQHSKLMEEQQKQSEKLKKSDEGVSKKASRKTRRTKRALTQNDLDRLFYINLFAKELHQVFHFFFEEVAKCQYENVHPGRSLLKFYVCLIMSGPKKNWISLAFRKDAAKPIDSSYDSREFKILTSTEANLNMDLVFHFDRMRELKEIFPLPLTNNHEFGGADPYLDEQYDKRSVSRYKYDNLQTNQRQPGWSFTGNDGPLKWPYLELKKFYFPTKSGVDLEKVVKLSDLAQTYPGIAEITGNLEKSELFTPIDHTWEPNQGYYIYTRFLLPLLTKKDVDYFELKGDIDDRNYTKDAEVLQEMIDGIDSFLKSSFLPLGRYPINQNGDDYEPFIPASYYPTSDTIDHFEIYRAFFEHYFTYDFEQYLAHRAELENKSRSAVLVHEHFETARLTLRSYAYAVRLQLFCMKQMVIKYEYRRQRKDQDDVVNEAYENCKNQNPKIWYKNWFDVFTTLLSGRRLNIDLRLVTDLTENMKLAPIPIQDVTYEPTIPLLTTLYKKYFDRKESRQRYSLPLYPHEFPICKHNEPSPVDINVKNGVKSSLRSYTFGDAAYRLQRFIMSFPVDGSNLLSVGIHRGERLDDSSVRLSGGAVKGQNLTFQQMNIRFSHSWKVDGSEHRFEGKGAPMELQMIFTVAGSEDAIKYFHILARVQNQLFQFREKLVIILAILVDVLETDADVKARIIEDETNQDPFLFEPLAQAAYHFRKQEETNPKENPRGYISLDPVFRFIDFIPKKQTKFFTYRGSLSWPPCFPYVLWSVFEKRLFMSKRQFDEFTKIPAIGTSDNNLASDNIRKLNDIWVEEENDPNADYTRRQRMKRARTVERLILEGEHDAAAITTKGVVSDVIYYLDDTSGAAPCFIPDLLNVSLAVGILACIFILEIYPNLAYKF